MVSRKVSWLNAINQIEGRLQDLNSIDLTKLDLMGPTDFDWFLSLLHRTAEDINRLEVAASRTIESQ